MRIAKNIVLFLLLATPALSQTQTSQLTENKIRIVCAAT